MKFEKENRQKPLMQFQLLFFYETHLFTEKFSQTTTIRPGIFGRQALWADSGPPRMNTVAPHDQFNPLTPGAFCKKGVSWTFLVVFGLDLGQITFNLVKNALASRQLGFLATGIAFCHILTRACAKIQILR